MAEQVDARKQRMSPAEAVRLALAREKKARGRRRPAHAAADTADIIPSAVSSTMNSDSPPMATW